MAVNIKLESMKMVFSRMAKVKTGVNINVVFDDCVDTAYTNGNTITISSGKSKVFDHINEKDKPLFIAGLFAHELMHCIKTPFAEMKTLCEGKYKNEIRKFRKIINVLEDPAIENFSSWFQGGYLTEGIKYVNECLFKEGPEIETIGTKPEQCIPDDLIDYMQWETAMLYYGWTRKLKNDFSSDKAKRVFYDNFELYNKIINEADNHNRLMLQEEYYQIVVKEFGLDNIPNENKNECGYGSECNRSGGQTDSDLSQAAQSFSDQMQNGKNSSSTFGTGDNSADADLSNANDSSGNSGLCPSTGSGEGKANPSNENGSGNNESDKEARRSAEKKHKDSLKNLNAQLDNAKKQVLKKVNDFKNAYKESGIISEQHGDLYVEYKSKNMPYIKQLSSSWKRLLTKDMQGKTFAASGNFNLDRYACKGHQTVNFFEKKKLPEEKFDAAICILLDISGSMRSCMEIAMSQVQVLVESLTDIGVDTCVIPFSGITHVLKEWGKPLKSFYLDAYGGTNTTDAVLLALNTLKYRDAKNRLCILITDGEPNDANTASAAIKEISKFCDIYTILVNCSNGAGYQDYFRAVFGDSFIFNEDIAELNKTLTPKIRHSLRKWK